MTTKILLISFHSALNAGDLGLLISTRDILSQAYPNCEITVSANNPDEFLLKEEGFKTIPSCFALAGLNRQLPTIKQLANFLIIMAKLNFVTKSSEITKVQDAYNNADIVMSVPGNQFFSKGRFGWPLPVNIVDIVLARKFRKPLIILPQSLGPLNRWWEKAMIKNAFGYAKKIYFRDENSVKLAETLNLPKERIAYIPDLAINLKSEPSIQAEELLQSYGVDFHYPTIGVTIIAKMSKALKDKEMEKYYQSVEEALDLFSKAHNLQIVFFNQVTGPTVKENDGVPTMVMQKALTSRGSKAIHINERLSPTMLKACYGKMDLFLASRLHSGLFSIGMCVPTLFLGYLSKTEGVVKSLGLTDNFIDIKDISTIEVEKKLELLWNNRNEKREQLFEVIKSASDEIFSILPELRAVVNDAKN